MKPSAIHHLPRRGRRGILLAEAMLSVVLMGIISVIAFQPFSDVERSFSNSVENASALMVLEQMVEQYQAAKYEGLGDEANGFPRIGVAGNASDTRLVGAPAVVVNGISFTRTALFPASSNLVPPRQPFHANDGWMYEESYARPGGGVSVIRYRLVTCTVTWAGGRSMSMDTVIRRP